MTAMRYTQDHEWVRQDGNHVTIGITDHAQSALGDVVFVELPEPGRTLAAGEACAVVESVKAASEVYAPVAGRVVEVNQALAGEPALANRSPEDEGWFFRIEPVTPGALDALMDAPAYAAFVEGL